MPSITRRLITRRRTASTLTRCGGSPAVASSRSRSRLSDLVHRACRSSNSASRGSCAQPGHGLGHRALDRADRAVQHLSHLGLGQVVEDPQHDHGPLPSGQRLQRTVARRSAPPPPPPRLPGAGRSGRVCGRPFPSPPAAAPARPGVHQDPAHVDFRIVATPDPLPARPRPHQRGLDQILGQAPVAGQQPRGSLQRASRAPRRTARILRPRRPRHLRSARRVH